MTYCSDVNSSQANPAYQRLRSQIETQVELSETTIRLGEQDFVWHRVRDPEQLLEAAAQAPDRRTAAELDPFWAATWRAAIGLDTFLSRLDLQDVRVLELGCGSGQAGIGAAARGGLVTMTDIVRLALQVAELNAMPVADRITFERLDWESGKLNCANFPIIIGSDLVYDTSLFPALSACGRRHLATGGRMFLSEPHRHTGDHFADWIRRDGWNVTEHDLDLQDQRVAVRVFECDLDL